MCGAHATVRGLLGELVANPNDDRDILVDMEAGLEHMSRGTGRHVSRFVAVIEPYFRSMETGRRVVELAAEAGITDVWAVANKVRNDADSAAVRAFCEKHGLKVVAEVPYDPTLVDAEREGRPPFEYDRQSPAIVAVETLAQELLHRPSA
jgi:CO dehydrogenase maturation factor